MGTLAQSGLSWVKDFLCLHRIFKTTSEDGLEGDFLAWPCPSVSQGFFESGPFAAHQAIPHLLDSVHEHIQWV
jgi:hypothetical protein